MGGTGYFRRVEPISPSSVPCRLIAPKEIQMKKISYVLAALATIALAAPAVAQDKPMKEGMDKPMMKEGMDKPMMHKRHHHHHHHHTMKQPMTDKKM
jgi:hypothetical protein